MHLFGASGHAKVIIEILELNSVQVTGLFDRDENIESLLGYWVKAESEVTDDGGLIISIGDNSMRKKLVGELELSNYVNAIHPKSIISSVVKIGKGVAVMANAVINTGSVIGDHSIINTSSSVDHDCQVDNFVHIAPKATLCGGIHVGEGTIVGAGAVIIPNITVGKWVTVGAGAVVTEDVPDHTTVVGNAARIVRVFKP